MRQRPGPNERRETRELENLLLKGQMEQARQRAIELSRQREERAKAFNNRTSQP